MTATPSRKPLIFKDWIKKGTHLSCMGSDMEGKQEIDPELLKISKLVSDDISQSISVGEFELAIKSRAISEKDIISEIGDVLEEKKLVRTSADDITVYDSTGIALQDIAVGYMAIKKAEELSISEKVKF